MTSQNPQTAIYEPKTLAAMDQAFSAIWKADDPFRDYANDSQLRLAIGRKLLNLVADGVTDPSRLRYITLGTWFCHAADSARSSIASRLFTVAWRSVLHPARCA